MNPNQEALVKIVSGTLFQTNQAQPITVTESIQQETFNQTVYLLLLQAASPQFYKQHASNIRVQCDHAYVHELLTAHHIPYVMLKGMVSASYYPDPKRRSLGDVDFLIQEEYVGRVSQLLQEDEFTAADDHGGIHIAFHREPSSTFELHWAINGCTDKVQGYLSDILEQAYESNGIMQPSHFHHCLILLTHTASHLTSEGVGLRHLCDWAVFINQIDVSQWEKELKDCGLWTFAKVLSQVCVKYLRCEVKCGGEDRPWFGTINDALCEQLMDDILNGGNFGQKDSDRTRQIKYISNRGERTVDGKPSLLQVFHTIKKKAADEKKSILGVVFDYAGMVLTGKRKIDTVSTIKAANQRKQLYSELKLYIGEKDL